MYNYFNNLLIVLGNFRIKINANFTSSKKIDPDCNYFQAASYNLHQPTEQ